MIVEIFTVSSLSLPVLFTGENTFTACSLKGDARAPYTREKIDKSEFII
jgi:hypothetical protein